MLLKSVTYKLAYMKTLIIFSGIVALMIFNSSKAANGFENRGVLQDVVAGNPNDMVVLDINKQKPIEEIIAEDILITEYQDESYQPLSVDGMIKDRIEVDNEIIESNISNECYPLDFKRINNSDNYFKPGNRNAKIPIILNL